MLEWKWNGALWPDSSIYCSAAGREPKCQRCPAVGAGPRSQITSSNDRFPWMDLDAGVNSLLRREHVLLSWGVHLLPSWKQILAAELRSWFLLLCRPPNVAVLAQGGSSSRRKVKNCGLIYKDDVLLLVRLTVLRFWSHWGARIRALLCQQLPKAHSLGWAWGGNHLQRGW